MTNQMTSLGRTSGLKFAALVLAAFYLPPLLIRVGLIPRTYAFVVLLVIAGAFALIALAQRMPAAELGFRWDNLKPAVAANAVLALAVGSGLLAAFWLGLIRHPHAGNWWWFVPFYVLISCPVQEFVCRGFLFAEMRRCGITGAGSQIAISAVSYAFLHIVFRDWLAFLAPLAIGVGWGALYRRYPNLWGVVLSHAVLGLISLRIGLI
ncbi:MAG: CPBP family intramembrane metalloprotease [Hyphomicrobiaceae bacterium]|nr:CPBP family intramembrane metalloprotease [Hyphomicrobiaceae bacterium]